MDLTKSELLTPPNPWIELTEDQLSWSTRRKSTRSVIILTDGSAEVTPIERGILREKSINGRV